MSDEKARYSSTSSRGDDHQPGLSPSLQNAAYNGNYEDNYRQTLPFPDADGTPRIRRAPYLMLSIRLTRGGLYRIIGGIAVIVVVTILVALVLRHSGGGETIHLAGSGQFSGATPTPQVVTSLLTPGASATPSQGKTTGTPTSNVTPVVKNTVTSGGRSPSPTPTPRPCSSTVTFTSSDVQTAGTLVVQFIISQHSSGANCVINGIKAYAQINLKYTASPNAHVTAAIKISSGAIVNHSTVTILTGNTEADATTTIAPACSQTYFGYGAASANGASWATSTASVTVSDGC
jgi:hypothetical protein